MNVNVNKHDSKVSLFSPLFIDHVQYFCKIVLIIINVKIQG